MRKIAVVGLGYVGLPVAVAFGQVNEVIGFDVNKERIKELKAGFDRTNEVNAEQLKATNIHYTTEPELLAKANFIIVAVPTPIDIHLQPDLGPIKAASKMIGKHVQTNAIVVFESTVYPGLTEEICIPILEENAHLKVGENLFVGYSPERINPGDKEHTFKTIKKIVAGNSPKITDEIAEVYGGVVESGVFKASSIKVAEAAKVIENTQRDVNIALMNELTMLFRRLNINTTDVLEAANTKWNFLPFKPGLVGGHCIGVDPYYLTHKANEVGFNPELITAGRRLNDSFATYVASEVVKQFIRHNKIIPGATMTILGVTFKENVPDIRNSKVFSLVKELEEYGMIIQLQDVYASPVEVEETFGKKLMAASDLKRTEAVLLAVPHEDYVEGEKLNLQDLYTKGEELLFFDLTAKFSTSRIPKEVTRWQL